MILKTVYVHIISIAALIICWKPETRHSIIYLRVFTPKEYICCIGSIILLAILRLSYKSRDTREAYGCI